MTLGVDHERHRRHGRRGERAMRYGEDLSTVDCAHIKCLGGRIECHVLGEQVRVAQRRYSCRVAEWQAIGRHRRDHGLIVRAIFQRREYRIMLGIVPKSHRGDRAQVRDGSLGLP